MEINGTLINYFFHCPKQCYLFGNRLNLEDNSELVQIGKAVHEDSEEKSKNAEILIDNIKLDKLTDEYITELKKSDADTEAAKWQLLWYLKVLKQKGIERKGKLEFAETKRQAKKIIFIELTQQLEDELDVIAEDIKKLLRQNDMPIGLYDKTCKKCAYFEYCYI